MNPQNIVVNMKEINRKLGAIRATLKEYPVDNEEAIEIESHANRLVTESALVLMEIRANRSNQEGDA